ncbi:MAG: dihydropteroate synthase [Candidatus Eremiobacteraeota bacterium]|nr:dihydropteroate synthase [Candidatus Eremiobacteraeota bacterium]MBC5827206.1 dihydropteroate synthase [Candidatus Eremiobacteraeota bacterium]
MSKELRSPLVLRGRAFTWGRRTYVMGIINATPDSFSGDGLGDDAAAAVERAVSFAQAGCDIIDVGGESTRPGHVAVPEAEEARRVIPVLRAIRQAVDLPLSIDTLKPAVASEALAAGADVVNCIWGAPAGIVDAVSRAHAGLVVTHNRAAPDYAGDLVVEVVDRLSEAANAARAGGVAAERIIVDPGIGFGKTADHNVQILSRLKEVADRLPYPLLVGASRKSFIARIMGDSSADRSFGTAAAVALAVAGGADIVRVHDVRSMVQVVAVSDAVCRHGRAVPREAVDGQAAIR